MKRITYRMSPKDAYDAMLELLAHKNLDSEQEYLEYLLGRIIYAAHCGGVEEGRERASKDTEALREELMEILNRK
jgi:hypothetical protein